MRQSPPIRSSRCSSRLLRHALENHVYSVCIVYRVYIVCIETDTERCVQVECDEYSIGVESRYVPGPLVRERADGWRMPVVGVVSVSGSTQMPARYRANFTSSIYPPRQNKLLTVVNTRTPHSRKRVQPHKYPPPTVIHHVIHKSSTNRIHVRDRISTSVIERNRKLVQAVLDERHL